MENTKIIETIRKIMELAANNPNENEAKAASLKAQELLAKYHISISNIDTGGEEIDEMYIEVGSGNKWKWTLAAIICANFCCKYFMYGNKIVVFYGHKTDIMVATNVYQTLFYTGVKLANKKYREMRDCGIDTRNVKNSFLVGYMAGIKEVLDKQCTALMIVTPTDVEEGYNELTKNMKRSKMNAIKASNLEAWTSGYTHGKNQMQSRQLEERSSEVC